MATNVVLVVSLVVLLGVVVSTKAFYFTADRRQTSHTNC